MSRYEQLRAAYEQSKNAELAYWAELQGLVRRIRKDFSDYLGIPEGNQVTIGSSTYSTISIGVTNEKGEFEGKAESQLPRNGGSIEFSLRLVFGNSMHSETKPLLIFPLSITKTEAGYPVTVKSDPDEPEFNGPAYHQLFDDLYRRAMSSLSR